MILYFSGTGNSLVIARQLSERLGEPLLSLYDAAAQDLTQEKRVGLVFPTYDFNLPPAVRVLVGRLKLSPKAYVFAVITCGGQAGNCVWTLRRMLREKGVELAYSHKVRVPDNSALAFGRNPNNQLKKLDRVPARMNLIVSELQAKKHVLHYSSWSLLAWIMGQPKLEKGMIRMLGPKVDSERCIGCNTCVRVCPQENIVLKDGKALIGDNCTACLSCVHFCPQQALQTNGRPTRKDRQYHHPEIQLKDLLRRG
ncbi:MAG: EFR1 family ferrodoxin [Paludibacteraceae bacterium]|nr:EFR1 family ferrodoxin [Paludibacteraceae bacterium]